MRYFKPLRTEMYAKMLGWIRRYTTDTPIYLCMESQAVWHGVFGSAPTCNAGMEQLIQQGEQQHGRRQDDLIPLSSLTLQKD